MTEPNYQKPPLREEIEEFFKQLKGVIFTIICITLLIIAGFGFYNFLETDMSKQIGIYINEHGPKLFFLAIIAFASYPLLYFALGSKYLIYKRYRLGYFSQMMWCFIGFVILQLLNISMYLNMRNIIPIITIELCAIGITTLILSNFKTNRPSLDRPLTKEENELRHNIIKSLVSFYKQNREGFAILASDPYLTTSDHAGAFAKACYVMDVYPELLKTVNDVPTIFYTNTNEELEKKLSIKIENHQYTLYYDRAYNYMKLRKDSSIPISPNLELFFD